MNYLDLLKELWPFSECLLCLCHRFQPLSSSLKIQKNGLECFQGPDNFILSVPLLQYRYTNLCVPSTIYFRITHSTRFRCFYRYVALTIFCLKAENTKEKNDDYLSFYAHFNNYENHIVKQKISCTEFLVANVARKILEVILGPFQSFYLRAKGTAMDIIYEQKESTMGSIWFLIELFRVPLGFLTIFGFFFA